MNEDRPYYVGYAKSGSSRCRRSHCSEFIAKDSLRIATFVQNSYHDGKSEKWYHAECFFQEHRVKTTGEIAHFDSIQWEDQEYIKQKIEENRGTKVSETGSRKRIQAAAAAEHKDFKAEYSKVDRTECHGCGWSLKKGVIRLSKKDEEGLDRWYDINCFAQLRSDMQFFDEGISISGVSELTEEDQDIVRRALPKIEKENLSPRVKKIKPESENVEEEEESLKIQQKELFSVRDELKSLKKKDLIAMLRANNQDVPAGLGDILDTLVDALLFGALELCPKCGGQFVFKSGTGYKCTGNLSEWVLCENIAQDPKRKKFAIPEDLKKKNLFINSFEPKVRRRLLKITVSPPSSSTSSFSEEKEDDVTDASGAQSDPRPLKYLTFVLTGFTEEEDEKLTRDVVSMGGIVKPKVNDNITAVITTQAEVEKMSSVVEEARKRDIHVVSENFVEEAKGLMSGALKLIEKMSITSWGSYPWMRVMNSIAMNSVPVDKSHYTKSSTNKQKLRVKGGATVDPDSKLDHVAHVYQCGDEIFTASLGETSVQTKRNSYYKLQILKHDKEEKYWSFRSYGRIGTNIGKSLCQNKTLKECIELFKEKFEEKTGNRWSDREFFQKKPKKMYLMIPDADHGDENTFGFRNSNVQSTLKKPIQDLMRLIFDIGLMKKAMMEYEIDTTKMPLGKISKKQIQEAHGVLSRLLELVSSGSQDRAKIIEETNKFYTLIPHNFGVDGPKLIETERAIQKKIEMLESLLEMNIAYKLVHSEMGTDKNPLDVYYEQLKTDIDVLDRESDKFKLIETYVRNTHSEAHDKYKLVVEQVFVAKRNGEESRYEPCKDFPDRKLLWHGSRVTNFAGILSQGLRIAPPEAPPTGYMFGKGVYFADMVSKSANYCYANAQNSTGLLLLCEVALGNMYERFRGERELPATLPDDCHSTWGRGKTQPDPGRSVKLETGVEVPCGPGIPVELEQEFKLLHNEFIVYDVAQVKVEYIVRLKFEYEDIRNNACPR